jgi:SCF-associated factor 1
MTFVAYSTGEHSIVLMGQNDASPTTNPKVIPSLQNRGVISVVLGDYHFGALLENGKLLTWGASGSTGLGDPYKIEPGQPGGFRTIQDRERNTFVSIPDVHVPTEVKFDHGLKKPRERFAFAAAAAGWHMGAIVVDLEEVSNFLIWWDCEISIGL